MFDFNPYSGLLLVGFVPGILYAGVLLTRAWREERWNDLFAAVILLTGCAYVAQWMLGFAGWYSGDWRSTIMFYGRWDHLLLLGPALLFYLQSATNTDWRWQRKHWFHLAPWLVLLTYALAVILYDFVYFRGITGQPFEYFEGSRGPLMEWEHTETDSLYDVVSTLIRLYLLVYLGLAVSHYRAYRRYVRAEFSNAGELGLPGLGRLIYVLLGGIILFLAVELYQDVGGASTYTENWWSYLFMAILILAAGIQFLAVDSRMTRMLRFDPDAPGSSTPATSSEEDNPAPSLPHPANNPSDSLPPMVVVSDELLAWAGKLNDHLEQTSAHLDPDLKLGSLAAAIGTNAGVLSKTINQVHGQNFNDFINHRRCAAFLDRLRRGEHERHTLLSLALDSGFNSKSTFNRAFRKQYGYSPGEALKRLKDTKPLDSNHDLVRPAS